MEVKTTSGTTAVSQGMPSPWLEGSLLLFPYQSLCVEMIPDSKLTSSEAIAGPHGDTCWHSAVEISYQATCYIDAPQGRLGTIQDYHQSKVWLHVFCVL